MQPRPKPNELCVLYTAVLRYDCTVLVVVVRVINKSSQVKSAKAIIGGRFANARAAMKDPQFLSQLHLRVHVKRLPYLRFAIAEDCASRIIRI